MIRNGNVFIGGIFLLFTVDHSYIQAINGKQLLTLCHVLSYFIIVSIKQSIRTSSNAVFQCIQQVARFNYKRFVNEPDLIDEVITSCKTSLLLLQNGMITI